MEMAPSDSSHLCPLMSSLLYVRWLTVIRENSPGSGARGTEETVSADGRSDITDLGGTGGPYVRQVEGGKECSEDRNHL